MKRTAEGSSPYLQAGGLTAVYSIAMAMGLRQAQAKRWGCEGGLKLVWTGTGFVADVDASGFLQ